MNTTLIQCIDATWDEGHMSDTSRDARTVLNAQRNVVRSPKYANP